MRLVGTLIVILGIIVALSLWNTHSLQASSEDLSRQIDGIATEIKKGGWEAAIQKTKQLEKTWAHKAKWWPIFLEHQEMDNIEFSLTKVKEYVASQDRALSLGQLSELKLMIEHIPRKEALTLENVL